MKQSATQTHADALAAAVVGLVGEVVSRPAASRPSEVSAGIEGLLEQILEQVTLIASREDAVPMAVGRQEAARLLGVGVDFFDEHVAPEVSVVRRGRRVLVPRAELERWLSTHAEAPAWD